MQSFGHEAGHVVYKTVENGRVAGRSITSDSFPFHDGLAWAAETVASASH